MPCTGEERTARPLRGQLDHAARSAPADRLDEQLGHGRECARQGLRPPSAEEDCRRAPRRAVLSPPGGQHLRACFLQEGLVVRAQLQVGTRVQARRDRVLLWRKRAEDLQRRHDVARPRAHVRRGTRRVPHLPRPRGAGARPHFTGLLHPSKT